MEKFKGNRKQIILALVIISCLSVMAIAATRIINNGRTYVPIIYSAPATATPTITNTPLPTNTPKPEPTSPPAPSGQIWVEVRPENPDKNWALCRFVYKYNDAGKPVMQIYPGDSKPTSERIKIPRGEHVLVYKPKVAADGGGFYWKLVDYVAPDGTELYLRQVDMMKLSPPLE